MDGRAPGQVSRSLLGLPEVWYEIPVSARLLWLACAAAVSIACDKIGPPPQSAGDAGPEGGDSDVGGDADGTTRCDGLADYIRLSDAQSLAPIVESPDRCLLYGADSTRAEVYIIDVHGDRLRQTISVGARPTDLALSDDGALLYVAVFGDQKILALDASTGAVIHDVRTSEPPYRIARGPNGRVFYVEESIFSPVWRVHLPTSDEAALTGIDFHEPDLESNAAGTLLYLGEAGQPGSRLFRFDGASESLDVLDQYRFDGGFGLPSPGRRVHLSEPANRVYWADRAFSAGDLGRMRGWLGDQVVASTSDGAIIATEDSLYDAATFVRFATRPHPGPAAYFSADGRWFYEFSPIGSTLYRTSVEQLIGVHRLGENTVPPGSLAQHNFNRIVCDPNRPLIYGLDAQQNQIVFIDRNTLLPTRAEIIGSSPTDLSISTDASTMVVATFGATEIAVLDLTNSVKTLKTALLVPGNPFRVALSSTDRIVFVEQDQYSDMTLVRLDNGDILDSITDTIFQADVDFDPTGRYLYAGEGAGPQSRLRRYDLRFDQLEEVEVSDDSFTYPARQVIYNNGFVYYAGRKFDGETLGELGAFGDEIIVVSGDGRFAVSRQRIYDTTTYLEVGALPEQSDLVAVDPNNEVLYQFDNATGALYVQELPN
jgi:hypothetical protein